MHKITQLETLNITELQEIAKTFSIKDLATNKQDIIYQILNKQAFINANAKNFKEREFKEQKKVEEKTTLLDGDKLKKNIIKDNLESSLHKKTRALPRTPRNFTSSKKSLSESEENSNSNKENDNAYPVRNLKNKLKEEILEKQNKTFDNYIDNKSQEKNNILPPKNIENNIVTDQNKIMLNLKTGEGLLEVMPDGFGFLRYQRANYCSSSEDIYVSQGHIKSLGLRTGDTIKGTVSLPKNADKYNAIYKVESINGIEKSAISKRVLFDKLCPIFPNEPLNLFINRSEFSTRMLNMFAPIGKGQRGMIVAPPKTGKTILLEKIAMAIAENHPEVHLIVLLICERPEEVTHMSRVVKGEVVASNFDEHPEKQVHLANIVLEKAKRLVETGKDVVVLMDSLTRLVRAYNAILPSSGKVLSGGLDINAVHKPKAFFGAARNIENGGSLTILATTLIETGSKMDEVIFEEFKGTGNMELQLDRKLANKRIYPAINIAASGTRNEDILLPTTDLKKIWQIRKYISEMHSHETMEFILNRMKNTATNKDFLDSISEANLDIY